MEQLAHHGHGHYAYVDTEAEARRLFVEQGGALEVVAGDVKVQVEFNPARVGTYRLIGYEHRLMKDQDFNDDKKDGGDMGSGHTVTALYEIADAGTKENVPGVDPLRYRKEPRLAPAAKTAELMTVKVRYKDPGSATSKLHSQTVADVRPPLAETSTDFRFAAAVAEFGLLLHDSPHKGTASIASVIAQARGGVGPDFRGHRRQFVQMAEAAEPILRAGRR
jgi:Ca-activated chloride channel family protein